VARLREDLKEPQGALQIPPLRLLLRSSGRDDKGSDVTFRQASGLEEQVTND
jgi:hypothetical protein